MTGLQASHRAASKERAPAEGPLEVTAGAPARFTPDGALSESTLNGALSRAAKKSELADGELRLIIARLDEVQAQLAVADSKLGGIIREGKFQKPRQSCLSPSYKG